jgi:hypothetical protein
MTEPSPDTFAAAIALLGLALDPKAMSARLTELRTAVEKAEAATAKLAADREQHAARRSIWRARKWRSMSAIG